MTKAKKKFKFSNQANAGALEALRDPFLDECFFDKGDIDVLTAFDDHRCIIIARTGSGKTALVERIKSSWNNKVIPIDPHDLALSFIANNKVIQTYEQLGVNLTPFYRLLWKHVFITEIIKKHFNITNQAGKNRFQNLIAEILRRDKAKEEAVRYLDEWGDKFWETTEFRVKDVVRKITNQIENTTSGGLKAGINSVTGSTEVGRKKSQESVEEQKGEIISKAHGIIDNIQLSKLQHVIKLLVEDILKDPQKTYYITIDQLDEDWVEDSIRYQLIFELLTTVSEFNTKLKGRVKIIVALREDLLQRVYFFIQEKQSHQFQKEKYEDLYYRLNWNTSQLKNLLRKRVEYLYTKKFTSEHVTLSEVFPDTLKLQGMYSDAPEKKNPVDYILERTMLVPRDVIRFMNRCIDTVTGSETGIFTKTAILNAEKRYSEDRLDALEDEWRINYPNLRKSCELLRDQRAVLTIADFDLEHNKIDAVFSKLKIGDCPIYVLLEQAYSNVHISVPSILAELFYIFFTVGIVGMERNHSSTIYWCYTSNRVTNLDFHDPETTIYIHPAYFVALGIKPRKASF